MTKATVTPNSQDFARMAAVKAMLEAHKGKFFTVTAMRKSPKKMPDGTVEYFMKINGRQGVKKYLKGGESTIKHKEDLVSLFSTDKDREEYRCFSAFNVLDISVGGSTLHFNEKEVLGMVGKSY